MVWKCCVPLCKSNSKIPVHRFPGDRIKAENWLKAIGKTDLIGAPQEVLAKLRICTLHFSENMILPFGLKRRLSENAIPILNVPSVDTLSHELFIDNVQDVLQVNDNSDTVLTLNSSLLDNEQNIVNINDVNIIKTLNVEIINNVVDKSKFVPVCSNITLQKKLRTQRKMLHKKKYIIKKQQMLIKKMKRKNKWEETTKDMPTMQRIFMEMLTSNQIRAPQENISHLKGTNNLVAESGQTAHMMQRMQEDKVMEYGHRYQGVHKALALTLYKTMGKRAYTCLRSVFKDIPSVQTLQLALHKIPVTTGLNPLILRHLEKIAPKMSMKDKVCILMWDEVSIQPKVTYDIRKDIICGLEDWGNNRSGRIADHALVFMLRGLNSGWKIPVSYNFCYRQTKTAQLIRCIKEHIRMMNNIGFHIVCTVCDQGSSNVAAINELLLRTDMQRNFERRTQRQTFEVEKKEIVPLYDPPHLIKGIRNNLLSKNLVVKFTNDGPEEIASWDVIKTAWIMDRELNKIRPQLKKLTAEHILEDKIKKMRVKHATQVLSGTVASFIETLTRSKCVVYHKDGDLQLSEAEGLATAEVVNFLNDLFDSVNGSDKEITGDNELRRPVSENSAHRAFWVSAKPILRSMYYVDNITRLVHKVPSLTNWLFTIDGFQKIWSTIQCKYGFKKLQCRYLNQDPLENFFGQIRSHAVRHNNPTPRQFEDSYITLLVSNMKAVSIVGGNCEAADDSSMLFSLEEYFTDVSNAEVHDVARKDIYEEPHELISDTHVSEEIIVASFLDHLREIINLILKEVNYCTECDACLTNSEFQVCARQLVSAVNKLLKTRSHRRNILHLIVQNFEHWNINMTWHICMEHHDNMFPIMVRVISKQTILWWCEKTNNMLKNMNIEVLKRDAMVQISHMKHKQTLQIEKCKRKRLLKDYRDSVRKNVR